jgi:cobalt-zinc-cadmium efflux system protein
MRAVANEGAGVSRRARAPLGNPGPIEQDGGMRAHAGSAESDRELHKSRLKLVLVLSLVFLVVEVVGGIVSGSLALLADATHLFADVAALILAYGAMTLAELEPTKKYTFGFHRAEILAAFVNAEILLVVMGFLFYEAYQRFHEPPEIRTLLMTTVAVAGLAANLVSMALLHGGSEHSMNLKAAYLEVLSDALGSLGVAVSAGLIALTRWFWLDPLVSAAIGLLVLPRAIGLLRQSAHVLLEGTPLEVDLAEVRRQLLEVPGVVELHDLHFWTLTSGIHSASVHIRAAQESPRGEVMRAVRRLLKESAGVEHSTIQVEWGSETTCETTDHA